MLLAKNWKIKYDSDWNLVLENQIETVKIIFSKKFKTYQLVSIADEEYYEEQYPILLNLEEHKMICSIFEELWEVKQ